MSADPRRRQPDEKSVGKVVLPQAVEDKSLIHSFTGFIQDVVPQAYGSQTTETKEKILWARFEQTDLNDPIFHSDPHESAVGPPILLVLGYSYGVQVSPKPISGDQSTLFSYRTAVISENASSAHVMKQEKEVWSISSNGEATELLSWFHGPAKFLKLIPSPLVNPNQKQDPFAHKRPLAAICDGGSSAQFCSINFLSLRGGEVVKTIKFKTPVLDLAVNRISVVVSFLEKIAIFNPINLEDFYLITTCYASPGLGLNALALGTRWLAYSEQKLIPYLKSAGGCESEGAQSYTATVLNAAKTLSQGLRDLSGSVANSLSANLSTSPGGAGSYMQMPGGGFYRSDSNTSINASSGSCEVVQPGVVTIVDLQTKLSEDEKDRKGGTVAHFIAHPEPIVSMCFDPSGMLLLTADKKGHRFHLFRVQPNLMGSSHATVHHLYILHRGDTSARVQDMTFSTDSRWVAVSSMRGTTHVFPVTPYGGPIGIRTHSTPHVVNKLSRFHRTAGIVTDGRNSPVLHETLPLSSSPTSMSASPPCPHPTTLVALAQIRSHSTLLSQSRHSSPQSLDENCLPSLNVVASFAAARTLDGLLAGHGGAPCRKLKNAVDSLFIMSSHGALIQYDLDPVPASSIPKDKMCDESPIELKVEAKVKWNLLPTLPLSACSSVVQLPLSEGNLLLSTYASMKQENANSAAEEYSYQIDDDDKWLSQVEIITHTGPHRRIWMGPQFTFKPSQKYGIGDLDATSENNIAYTAKSNPVTMPGSHSTKAPVPVFIESGSSSSLEQSPLLMESYGGDSDSSVGMGELKLQEDIAEAMMESPVCPAQTNEFSDSENPEKVAGKKRRGKKKRR